MPPLCAEGAFFAAGRGPIGLPAPFLAVGCRNVPADKYPAVAWLFAAEAPESGTHGGVPPYANLRQVARWITEGVISLRVYSP